MKYFKNPIISKDDARFNFMILHWDNTGYIKHISREYIRELKIRLREYCKREGEKRKERAEKTHREDRKDHRTCLRGCSFRSPRSHIRREASFRPSFRRKDRFLV